MKTSASGYRRRDGYIVHSRHYRKVLAHVEIAERALGKSLPRGAVVHHIDGDPSNNTPSNLVICPDQSYHQLIHQRMRALAACGHTDWLKCSHCGQYDARENLYVRPNRSQGWHLACRNAQLRAMKKEN